MSLRARLLASYLLLLTIAIGVIAMALLLLLSARPAPLDTVYQGLAQRVLSTQDLLVEEIFAPAFPQRPFQSNRDGATVLATLAELEVVLDAASQVQDVRLMVVSLGNRPMVRYDSADLIPANTPLPLEQGKNIDVRRRGVVQSEILTGSFENADGAEWVYSALVFATGTGGRRGEALLPFRQEEPLALMAAVPRPQQSLQTVLADFSSELALPLIQAALVGMFVAFWLAYLISRTIANPLRTVSRAAMAAAEGDYNQRVPEQGPPEVRAVAESFNRMSAQVRDSQQAERDFLINVSHDLKTPLTSIQGFSQAIMDGTAKNPAAAANIIYEEAARLNRMVTELTDLARIQAGRLSFHASAVDMGQVTAAVAQRLAVVARDKKITLHVDAQAMPMIAGDGDRLAQVLNNLIGNAIKYTPEGGSVWVQTRAVQNGVEVVVRDTGIGIPEKELSRIFERFYQVDKTRGPQRGTGLGLAITKEIVQAHGGRITVESKGEGWGSTFTIWLPLPQVSTVARRN